MGKSNDSKFMHIFHVCYEIYHFVAKVILYSILIILILVFIGLAVYFADLYRNIKNGVNKPPLLNAYIVVTPSMVPTIKVEDAIVIMRKEAQEFKKKDIITFTSTDSRYSGLTITHRIVGIEKLENGEIYFRTKGDNNNAEDASLVPASNVYGKVILRIPKIGYIQYLFIQSYGWIILIVVPCLGIVLYDILKIFKSLSKSRHKDNENKKDDGNKDKHDKNKRNKQKRIEVV